jgi:hypothetical protein
MSRPGSADSGVWTWERPRSSAQLSKGWQPVRRMTLVLLSFVACFAMGVPAAKADFSPVATYTFQNSLAAQQSGVASLSAVDPQGASGFVTDTLYGQTRQVYAFNGNTPPAEQAGLSLTTTGLVASDNYSVEMVFSFSQNPNAWRRIIDVQERTSDNGFYVDPANNLDVYPVAGSSALFTENTYHDVVLTVASGGTVVGYLDGVQQFTTTTAVMNINNPDNLMNFFLDNTVGGGQGEYSSGQIGLINLYNNVLTADQVARDAVNPFVGSSTVPEPSSLLMVGSAGLIGLGLKLRTRRRGIRAGFAPGPRV